MKKKFSIVINCRGNGIIAAINFVNIKVLYAAERTFEAALSRYLAT